MENEAADVQRLAVRASSGQQTDTASALFLLPVAVRSQLEKVKASKEGLRVPPKHYASILAGFHAPDGTTADRCEYNGIVNARPFLLSRVLQSHTRTYNTDAH
jgi:hypothetical protein